MLNGKCAFNCNAATKRNRNETEKSRTSKFINLHFHRAQKDNEKEKKWKTISTGIKCPIDVNVIKFLRNVLVQPNEKENPEQAQENQEKLWNLRQNIMR